MDYVTTIQVRTQIRVNPVCSIDIWDRPQTDKIFKLVFPQQKQYIYIYIYIYCYWVNCISDVIYIVIGLIVFQMLYLKYN